MVCRYLLALAVLGVSLAVAAGPSQAGWGGHSHESTQPGESLGPESTSPALEESTGAYDTRGERTMESSESMEPRGYEGEGPIETGRLPESERFESGSNVIFGDDVEKRLQEGSVPGGP